MQRELDALLRALSGDQSKRARIQGVFHEILYAIQMHNARLTEADHELIARLQRALDDVIEPVPPPVPRYQNGQYGPYG